MIWVLLNSNNKKKQKHLDTWEKHLSSSFPKLSFTPDSSPPTLLLPQVILSPFSEATGDARHQGQDVAVSLCCYFLLTQFPCTNVGPLWAVILLGEYLLQHGLIYGSLWGGGVRSTMENILFLLSTWCSLCCFSLLFFFFGLSSSACRVFFSLS